ncbi:hypothetical protein FDJ25_gp162 [Vibrio phage Aphrodite1]|uniref:HTH araC/xylS-type domain-containing protein n=1 Tax=Vibrio phage Aphrodite1 TaxID=2070057 RepID=A0A2I7QHW2_9CAUD|nr:hypothetical protein FDJ25_gp162 [Vibrio phage Aphrodite1]AUR80987.1 hypothetical protein Aphrodite1_0039 [Vibrio phage Aphrodite1]
MKQTSKQILDCLSEEDRLKWERIEQEVKGKLHRVTVVWLSEHLGISQRTITRLINTVTYLTPTQWLLDQRYISTINVLKDPNYDLSGLQEQVGYKHQYNFYDYFRKRFPFTFPEIAYLHSLGLSKDFIEGDFDNIEEFLAFEMIQMIQRTNGKIKVKEDLLNFFGGSHTWFYRVWYRYNGPESPSEFISFTRIRWLRRDFLESNTTPNEYFLKNKLGSHNVDYTHKVHYGITFRAWASKQIEGKPRRRKNGCDELLGEEWLERIKQHITYREIDIETISKKVGLSTQAMRKVITYYCKKTYFDFKCEVLASKQSNLTVRSYV